jgi:hypothetical protein
MSVSGTGCVGKYSTIKTLNHRAINHTNTVQSITGTVQSMTGIVQSITGTVQSITGPVQSITGIV